MKHSVKVPEALTALFEQAENRISDIFSQINFKSEEGQIEISGEPYILLRASSLAIDFFDSIVAMYGDKEKEDATSIARQFLFDVAHAVGSQDAEYIADKLDLKSPIEKLAAGP